MYSQKRKEKTVVDKEFQDQIKEVKSILNDAKNIIERASSQEDYTEALQMLNKAISKASTVQVSNTYHLYYYRGLCFLNLAELDKAERDFIESAGLADDKGKVQIYNSLGRCKVEMAAQDPTYFEQAIKCYQTAIQASKQTDGEAYLRLAGIYRRLKENRKAIDNYVRALNPACNLKSAQQFEAYMQRGLCFNQEKDKLNEAISDFSKACQIKKQDAGAHFQLGSAYYKFGKYPQGLRQIEIALGINPTEPKYRNQKGFGLFMIDQHESALVLFKQTLKLFHERAVDGAEVGECYYNLGNALLKLSHEEDAIEAFNSALQYPVSSEIKLKVYYGQGLAYESKKNPEAIKRFLQSLSLIGDNKMDDLYLSSLYHIAVNQHMHKKYSEAIKHVNKIVDQGCYEKCVYELRGRIYLDDQKYSLALKNFEILLSIDPGYPQVYYYLGMTKANLGEIDAAIADFFKAVDLGCRNSSIMNGISYAYLKAGRPEKALVYINLALEKLPLNQDFLIQRSMVYIELGQNHKGIQDLTKALSINKTNAFTYYRRGLSYYKNRQFEQAITDLTKALQYEPNEQIQDDIHYLIGVSYASREQFEAAVEPFSRAITLSPQARYYHERAKCYILLDRNSEALDDLNQVIKEQPSNAFAYFRRGLTYKALKLYEEAAENFMKARDIAPDDPRLIIDKKQIYETKYRKLCEPGQEE